MEVITFIDYEAFREFEGEADARSQKYLRYKERIYEKLINSLEKVIPGIREKIVQMELGTPVTNEFYINSTRGSAYGTEKNFWQTGPFSFKNKSEIENLYLCGASILAHGVSGSTNSGIETAAKILKCTADDLLAANPDQHVRVYDAEDSSQWPQWIHQKMEDRKRCFKEIPVYTALSQKVTN